MFPSQSGQTRHNRRNRRGDGSSHAPREGTRPTGLGGVSWGRWVGLRRLVKASVLQWASEAFSNPPLHKPPTSHLAPRASHLAHRTSHIAPRASHLAPRTSHLAPRASHIALRTSRIALRTSHFAPRTSHLALRTSHFALRTSYFVPRISHLAHQTSGNRKNDSTGPLPTGCNGRGIAGRSPNTDQNSFR